MNTFARRLSEGLVGESVIADLLRGSGFSVLPVYEIGEDADKGPRLFAPQSQIIAPDMFVYKGESAAWIEAKHKSGFTYSRRHGRYVTGIDLKHYLDYLKVSEQSPFPVWLMFLQRGGWAKDNPGDGQSPAGLYGGELSTLRHCENHRHEQPMRGQRHGMVYWAESSLIRFCDVPQAHTAPSAPRLGSFSPIEKKRSAVVSKEEHAAALLQIDKMYEDMALMIEALWSEQQKC